MARTRQVGVAAHDAAPGARGRSPAARRHARRDEAGDSAASSAPPSRPRRARAARGRPLVAAPGPSGARRRSAGRGYSRTGLPVDGSTVSLMKPRVGERLRIGRPRAPAISAASGDVEQRLGARVVGRRRGAAAAAGSGAPEVDAVEPASRSRKAPTTIAEPAPARRGTPCAQVARRLAVAERAPDRRQQRGEQQPQHDVGPEQDEFGHRDRARRSGQPHARIDPGVGDVDQHVRERCRAASRGRPSCARWRSPAPRSRR